MSKTFPPGSPQAVRITIERVVETINAINECLPTVSGAQAATAGLLNACTDFNTAVSVLSLQMEAVICWLGQGGNLNCEQPDACACYTVNYPQIAGSIDLWYPFLQCVTVPDTTIISGHLTTSPMGTYDVRGGNMPFFTSLTLELVNWINGYVFIAFQEQLQTFSAPELDLVSGNFQVGSNANQHTLNIPKIRAVTGNFITSGTLYTELLVPLLTTVGGILMSIGGLALTTVDISSLTNFDGDFECVNAALTEDSVNNILIVLDSQCVLSNRLVLLNAGSSAAPSGAGITAATNLTNRGCQVQTN